MDKTNEKEYLDCLLRHLPEYEYVQESESPDFIIKSRETQSLIGVEVTKYFPHRDSSDRAIVLKPGKDDEEGRNNRLDYFKKTDFGHMRFVPRIDAEDFYNKVISTKGRKLSTLYKKGNNPYKEYWLLVVLSFYDNVVFEEFGVSTEFDRLFFFEEPDIIFEMIKRSNA